jgi:perosamine synthetase
MNKFIQNHPPVTSKNEKNFVSKCLEKDEIAVYGEYLGKFKKKISNITKSKYVNLVSNGTSAIHLCLIASGVSNGNEVLVPSFTFIGSCNPILHLRAKPIFFDVDNFHNINEDKLIKFLKNNTTMKNNICINKKTKNQIKAIIVVHMWGNAAKIEKIITECKKRKIIVIEDAAEALGTKYITGKYKGFFAGTIGDFGCLSFNSNKIITSAGGGAVLSKKIHNYKLIESLKDHGRSRLGYSHDQVGYNYNLSNIHASIGYAQSNTINKKLKFKKNLNKKYCNFFKKSKIFEFLRTPDYSSNNCWMNILKMKNKKIIINDLIHFFLNEKIEIRKVWKPCHSQPFMKKFNKQEVYKTDELYKKCICLPSGFNITTGNFKKITKAFIKYEDMFNHK